ncbi:hypothetical protein B0H14DRAFT_1453511 [Mycena olivaceomarginata]|nr:hypothetical protein B0H14DRAFT_1453511 [Mycena olivaceomarginata]
MTTRINRVCQYMIRCVNLLPPPDDISFLWTAHKIYVQHRKFPEALALAIRLGDPELIREDFNAPGNLLMKRELAFLLAALQPTDKSKNRLAPLTITSLNTAHTVHPQFGVQCVTARLPRPQPVHAARLLPCCVGIDISLWVP